MEYYVKPLKNTGIFDNQYHIFRGMEGIIDIRNDYWYTHFYLYSSGNFHLPLNSLLATYILPYQEIEGVAFNISTSQGKKEKRESTNRADCTVYETSQEINIASNQFLKSVLNNVQIKWQINFEIDPTPLTHVAHNIAQNDLDNLINETSRLSHSFDMYYSNNYKFSDKQQSWNITNQYELNMDGTIYEHSNVLTAIANDYSKYKQPIILLATLKSNKKFQITDVKIKFVYKITGDENSEKVFEIGSYPTNKNMFETNIYFDAKTLYDHTNKKINNSIDGITGFYIPKFSSGYYQITFNLYQDYNLTNCILINPFSFDVDNDFPKILITPTVINSLEGYTFKKF